MPGRAARNTVVLVVLRLVVPAASLALVLALSRVLGAEGLGRYTLAFGFLTLLGGLAPLGLPSVVTRDGAQDLQGLDASLRNALTLGAAASVLLTLVMAGLGPWLSYDRETQTALLILSLAILPYAVGMLLDGAIVAIERMDYMAAAMLSEYLIKVGVGLALLLLGFGLNAVLLTAVAGRVVGCLVSARLLHRANVRVGWGVDPAVMRRLASVAPTFLLTAVFASLYWRVDILMLSKLARVEDIGYYGAAYRLFELAVVFPQSLCLSLYPHMAAAARSDKARLAELSRTALRYLFVISLPAALVLTILARPLLSLLYGDNFEAAGSTLAILAWSIIPYGVVRYHAYILLAAHRQRIDLWLNIVMSFVNAALNLVLIPLYGHFGAACATFVSICVLGLLQYAYLRRALPGHTAAPSLPPVVILAAALAGAAAWLLRESNIVLALILVAVIYLASLLVGRFFNPSELKFLHLYALMHRIGLTGRLER